jgi:Na+/melibiose symporter-like transporter
MRKEKRQSIPMMTTRRDRLCYYSGFAGAVGESLIVGAYLNTFLLLSGINLAAVAVALGVIKVIDAIDDVIFGYLIDRIKFRRQGFFNRFLGKGKYLPWMRAVFLFLPLTGMMIFQMPFDLSDTAKLTWFTISYFLYDLSYTLMDVPMNSAIMTLTDSLDERNKIVMQRTYPQFIIGLLISIVAIVLISEQVGVSMANGALILSVFVLVMLIPLFAVRERNVDVKEVDEKYSFTDMLKYLKSNKYLAILYLGNIAKGVFGTGSAVGLFVAFYLFRNAQFSIFYVVIGIIPILVINAFIPSLAKKYDKFKMSFIMTVISVFTTAVVYFAGYASLPRHIILASLNIIPAGFSGIMLGYLIQNCVEYGKYKSGVDGTGISFAIQTFSIKITAISSSIGIFILSLFGWKTIEATDFADLAAQNVTQSAEALRGLWIVNTAIPIIGALLGVIIWSFYRLKDKDVAIMLKVNEGKISREEGEKLMSRKY